MQNMTCDVFNLYKLKLTLKLKVYLEKKEFIFKENSYVKNGNLLYVYICMSFDL